MHIKPNKDVHLCSRKSIPLGNLNDVTPNELFNSEKMNNIRDKMKEGKCVAGCEKCYHEETINNGQSLRTFMNNWFEGLLFKDTVLPWKEGFLNNIEQPDTSVFSGLKPSIKWVALHASNVCNLACRGCYSLLSTKWRKDEVKLGINPYPLQNSKLNEFGFDFNDVDFITMYGGEPFFMKQNDELTNLVKNDVNISRKILQYFTNGMILPSDATFEIWERIKKLHLIISIDSYGDENDYFRYGSKWDTIVNNLHLYINKSKEYGWELRISTLINIYNVHNLDILHNWLITQGIDENNIDYNLAIYPQELDIRNLPQEYKDSVLERYNNIKLPLPLINMVINQLTTEPNIDFIASSAFSNKLDEIRNESNPITKLKVYMNE
jgi:organic radical activating enzyme